MKFQAVTLTVSKYGVTVAISSCPFLFVVVFRRGSYLCPRPHVCLVSPRAVSGAGTPGEGRTFLIRIIAKVIRSDRHRPALSTLRLAKSASRLSVPPHSPMARVYANVNALSGPKWYDYGP